MVKDFYFDTETTGLDPVANDLVSLAYIIEINGCEVDKGLILSQPFSYENVTDESLEKNGLTLDEIHRFPLPDKAFQQLAAVLDKHIDKFNRADKFYPWGYKVDFDMSFLNAFFRKNNSPYFGSYIKWKPQCVYNMLCVLDRECCISFDSLALENVARVLEIPHTPHNAMSDIEVTRAVGKWARRKLELHYRNKFTYEEVSI